MKMFERKFAMRRLKLKECRMGMVKLLFKLVFEAHMNQDFPKIYNVSLAFPLNSVRNCGIMKIHFRYVILINWLYSY